MIYIVGPKDKFSVKNGLMINTTSSSSTWSKKLSPFVSGPVITKDQLYFHNVENAWQYSKVYADQVDQNNNPTSDYYAWREYGQGRRFADRYPKGKGAHPLYTLYNGEKLDYITARKQVYMPLYRQSMLNNNTAFATLKEVYKTNCTNIILFDYDGYNHRELNMSYEDVINNPKRKMGHAFVLAMMLEGLY